MNEQRPKEQELAALRQERLDWEPPANDAKCKWEQRHPDSAKRLAELEEALSSKELLKRLRTLQDAFYDDIAPWEVQEVCTLAADEIERLRADLQQATASENSLRKTIQQRGEQIERLRAYIEEYCRDGNKYVAESQRLGAAAADEIEKLRALLSQAMPLIEDACQISHHRKQQAHYHRLLIGACNALGPANPTKGRKGVYE